MFYLVVYFHFRGEETGASKSWVTGLTDVGKRQTWVNVTPKHSSKALLSPPLLAEKFQETH
jgi:hypothetical protein